MMRFIAHGGDRWRAGFIDVTGDCVWGGMGIASGRPYARVYQALAQPAAPPSKRVRAREWACVTRVGG
jgi:hypothetical protein